MYNIDKTIIVRTTIILSIPIQEQFNNTQLFQISIQMQHNVMYCNLNNLE